MFKQEYFCQRLKEMRMAKKLTLEQLGKELGVAKQTVGHWETGYRLPPFDVTVTVADYFNVSLDYLAGRTNNPKVIK
jgi:transcriptional regulator with XRE-family HTH domain